MAARRYEVRMDVAVMSGTNSTITRRGLFALGAGGLSTIVAPDGRAAERKRTILFFSKSAGFEHNAVKRIGGRYSLAERTLVEIGRRQGIDVVATKDGRVFDGDLARYDAFFFFTTGDL